MRLNEIRNASQFAAFYAEKKLETASERIAYLKRAMGVFAMLHSAVISDEEELAILEEHALKGWDGKERIPQES